MPQISTQEFERLPLRVHQFLADVPVHDVWVVELPRVRAGITLDEFVQAAGEFPLRLSPVVRALLGIRFAIGRIFNWDRGADATVTASFASRLTPDDRSTSLAPAGRPVGVFRMVYRFENEQLLEVINRTVHGAALTALVDTGTAYRFYFGVYVRSVGRLTAAYMAVIDPVRKLIVYPSLLRSVRAAWSEAFGA